MTAKIEMLLHNDVQLALGCGQGLFVTARLYTGQLPCPFTPYQNVKVPVIVKPLLMWIFSLPQLSKRPS